MPSLEGVSMLDSDAYKQHVNPRPGTPGKTYEEMKERKRKNEKQHHNNGKDLKQRRDGLSPKPDHDRRHLNKFPTP